MKFKSLSITSWKQFETVDIQFHPSITIFTGSNGSGKTTILNILAKHFGWNKSELSTPSKNISTGKMQWTPRNFGGEELTDKKIGAIVYDRENSKSDLLISKQSDQLYNIHYANTPTNFKGINIPSHRPIYSYQQVTNIPTQKKTKNEAYQAVNHASLQVHNNGHSRSSNYFIKETLINWAITGANSEHIISDKDSSENLTGFEDALKKMLPSSIGFKKIRIITSEVILETESGDFMLDAVSGGMSAIIDLTWQIYNCERNEDGGLIVLIDEIENHLHPSMQRKILPGLVEAFPKIQFIVSTHSPLVVGSARDSKVYAFAYNDKKRVVSQELDLVNKAKTASHILNDVLGVPVTMPIWAEDELNRVLLNFKSTDNPEQQFAQIRQQLINSGLGDYFPDAIVKLSKDWI